MTERDMFVNRAAELMRGFAERTGLCSGGPGARYLWTDAFAVCNFLGLAHATGDTRHTELARRLIDRVHRTLGQHRADDARSGWLSGLGPLAGEEHPTRGGLRIGKRLPERPAGEPIDEELEWDRDGQYFHYLTKWMHALDQAARAASAPRYNAWACELAEVALSAFSRAARAQGRRGLVWKMSIDLSRPLVPAVGAHDPLDGFITCLELRRSAARLTRAAGDLPLDRELNELRPQLESAEWSTEDPLGIGGLLADACHLSQLVSAGGTAERQLLNRVVADAVQGLRRYAASNDLGRPAAWRLAFRELGLAIGLQGVPRLSAAAPDLIEQARRHVSLVQQITMFWLDPAHQRAPAWSEHRDINEVMLATSLVPDGFLVLGGDDIGSQAPTRPTA